MTGKETVSMMSLIIVGSDCVQGAASGWEEIGVGVGVMRDAWGS